MTARKQGRARFVLEIRSLIDYANDFISFSIDAAAAAATGLRAPATEPLFRYRLREQ